MTKPQHHDAWFELAQQVESRKPHAPRNMLSLSSKGPIWSFACTMPNCQNEAQTLPMKEFVPPKCYGGMPWSFSTKGSREI